MKSRLPVTFVAALFVAVIAMSSNADVRPAKQKTADAFRSPGKMSAPIRMQYSFLREPELGKAVTLDVTLFSSDQTAMQVEISGPAELGVGSDLQRLRSGGTLRVDLLPQQEGRYYVNFVARIKRTGHARVFQIPVQIGSSKLVAPARKATLTPDGERLVRLPAQ